MVKRTKAPVNNMGAENAFQTQNESEKVKTGIELRVDWVQATFRPDESDETRYKTVENEPGQLTGGVGFTSGTLDDYEIGEYNTFDAEKPDAIYEQGGIWDIRRKRAVIDAAVEKKMSQVVLAISLAMGVAPEDWFELPRGRNGYARAIQGPNGAHVDYAPIGDSERFDFHVTLGGKACGAIGHERMVKLMQYMERAGTKYTRLDIVMDDFDKVMTPAGLEEIIKVPKDGDDALGVWVSHATDWLGLGGGKMGCGDDTEDTIYIGSPKSRNYLRVYDKDAESKGEIPAIRWELQCRAESAETLGPLLAAGDWKIAIPQRFVSFIDFRARDKERIEARTRLGWWKMLVEDTKRAKMYEAKALKTLEDMADWAIKTVAPTFAAIYQGTGQSMAEMSNFLRDGMKRMKPRQKDAVLAWQGSGKGNLRLSYDYAPSGLAAKMKKERDAFYSVA
jgi:DNA relaxase NicK